MEKKKKPDKIKVWQETEGTETITVIKTAETTTRVHRQKLHDALQKIIRDPATRARLEAHPAEAMVEMGIELDDKEKAVLAGRRLSEVFALLGKSESSAVGYFPESVVDVVANVIATGPETVTATVSSAATEAASTVTVETAGEEVVVVLVVAG